MWCLSDLAEHCHVSITTMQKRVEKLPPELWAEPLRKTRNRKPKPKVKQLTAAERKLRRPYTEDELLELYSDFRGASDELQRLADFMVSDVEAASTQIVKWKVEGRI